jgi:exosortase
METLANDKANGPTLGAIAPPPTARGWARIALLCLLALLWLGLLWQPSCSLVRLALRSDPYSLTLFVPFVSAAFLYWQRKKIFSSVRWDVAPAAFLLFAGLVLFWLGHDRLGPSGTADELFPSVLSLVVLLIGSFVLCCGLPAARAAAFPLLFLLLMVPVPQFALDGIISALQHWTADCAAVIFNVLGIPVHRTGLVFDLPGISILVAEECSGIRSSMALLITVLLAAQICLKSAWRKLILCVLVLPIAVAKNAIRIVTLSSLAVYVDREFLFGRLHREGGVVFFLLGLGVSLGILRLLEMWERSDQRDSIRTETNLGKRLPQTPPIC